MPHAQIRIPSGTWAFKLVFKLRCTEVASVIAMTLYHRSFGFWRTGTCACRGYGRFGMEPIDPHPGSSKTSSLATSPRRRSPTR